MSPADLQAKLVLGLNPVWPYIGLIGVLLVAGAVARVVEGAREGRSAEGDSGALDALLIIVFGWWPG
ncbi:MAG: hypothetical protein OEM67_12615 [Thermoleophilia bacterium]|nr:hypothetical protein [Thermoleophilia bacterium]